MSYRLVAVTIALCLAFPSGSTAQDLAATSHPTLGPSSSSVALRPSRAPLAVRLSEDRAEPAGPQAGAPASPSLLLETLALAGASLAGLWIGAQPPFPAMDDDSDLGVGHLITAPLGSIAAVWATSVLFGNDGSSSLKGSALGAAAGFAAAVATSSGAEGAPVPITYAMVHGLVTAMQTR